MVDSTRYCCTYFFGHETAFGRIFSRRRFEDIPMKKIRAFQDVARQSACYRYVEHVVFLIYVRNWPECCLSVVVCIGMMEGQVPILLPATVPAHIPSDSSLQVTQERIEKSRGNCI